MTSPLSYVPKLPFIFRHVEKLTSASNSSENESDNEKLENQPDSILIWGRTVVTVTTESSKAETCLNYDQVNTLLLKYFPKLNYAEVQTALNFCSQFDVIPYRY